MKSISLSIKSSTPLQNFICNIDIPSFTKLSVNQEISTCCLNLKFYKACYQIKNPLYNSFVANANPLIWLLIEYISHGTYSGLDTNYTVTKFGIYKRAYSDLGKETQIVCGINYLKQHRGSQGTLAYSDIQKLQIDCNVNHTCVACSARPSWFTSKTSSSLYVTDIVSAVWWASFLTAIPICSRCFTSLKTPKRHYGYSLLYLRFLTPIYVNSIIFYFFHQETLSFYD